MPDWIIKPYYDKDSQIKYFGIWHGEAFIKDGFLSTEDAKKHIKKKNNEPVIIEHHTDKEIHDFLDGKIDGDGVL